MTYLTAITAAMIKPMTTASLFICSGIFFNEAPPYAGLRAGPDSTFTNLTFGPFGQWIFPRRRHGGPSLAQQLGSNNGTRESRLEKSSPLFAFAASP